MSVINKGLSMAGFDPHDPIDPLGKQSFDPVYGDRDPLPFDPGFQNELQMASDAVLRKAEQQAQVTNPQLAREFSDELHARQMRDEQIYDASIAPDVHTGFDSSTAPPEPPRGVETVEENFDVSETELSDEDKLALFIHFLSTTVVPLDICDADDYQNQCDDCGVAPTTDGPHHDPSCSNNHPFVRLDTKNAHNTDCRHCEARPAVAGFHHEEECPRGFPAITNWSVGSQSYEVSCSNCGETPDSEGPHHDPDCSAHADIPLYHTSLAHSGYCAECGALPFVAGPHHRTTCDRYIDRVPIRLA